MQTLLVSFSDLAVFHFADIGVEYYVSITSRKVQIRLDHGSLLSSECVQNAKGYSLFPLR